MIQIKKGCYLQHPFFDINMSLNNLLNKAPILTSIELFFRMH